MESNAMHLLRLMKLFFVSDKKGLLVAINAEKILHATD